MVHSFHTRSRARKIEQYFSIFPAESGQRVIDIGVTAKSISYSNPLLVRYPYLRQYTGVGVDDLSGLAAAYPEATFVRGDGCDLPFADDAFDIAFSNAVVEHVGDGDRPARFIREAVRVARTGFITTPNRWFPIELHTHLPLLHWLPRDTFVRVLHRLGRLDRSSDWHAWLLSTQGFRQLFPPGLELQLIQRKMLGLSASNVIVFRKP